MMLKIVCSLIALVLWTTPAPAVGSTHAALMESWARLKYEPVGSKAERLAAAEALEAHVAALQDSSPDALLLRAEVLCLIAEILNATTSLAKVAAARDLLEQALAANPRHPGVLSLLGSLHYEVPGWPISFGSRKKAEQYLRRAVDADPNGRDANFFMGDFLLGQGQTEAALRHLQLALAAPQQDTVLDRGQRGEIEDALRKAQDKADRGRRPR
jgi:tetratricopeptide (TPR) repeat protein